MGDFRFTNEEWDKISAELARTGHLKWDGDRQILEMVCDSFTRMRPRLGRDAPTPNPARAAWRKVALAARKLEVAIAGLRAAGAADFTVLDAGHQIGAAKWKVWSAQLPLLPPAADWAAELEMAGAHTVSNAADPMCDGFVKRLMTIWKGYGGRLAHTEDGPLVRFLTAVTEPALILAGEKPMTADAVREIIKKQTEVDKSGVRHIRMVN